MKKLFLIILIIISVILTLPIIGNKVVKEILNDRVELLTSFGLEVKKQDNQSGYLKTKTHYEFELKDEKKFFEYIKQFSDKQIPIYISAMLQGAIVGSDIEYSNFPFSDAVSVDIYPITLSKKKMDEIEKEDKEFYSFVESFLAKKGFLYHINYNILDKKFDGYIKDIKESYPVQDGTKVDMTLDSAKFFGEGRLMTPQSVNLQIKSSSFVVKKGTEGLLFDIKDFKTTSNFNSKSTYLSSSTLKKINIFIKDVTGAKGTLRADDIYIHLSSNTQSNKAEVYAKNSFKKIYIESQAASIEVTNFNSDISLNGLDKDTYEEFLTLSSSAQTKKTELLEKELQENVIKLLSKGLTLNIADFSLDNITYSQNDKLGGFSLKSSILVKKDLALKDKISQASSEIMNNIEMDMMFEISKKLFGIIEYNTPLIHLIKDYSKQNNGKIIYDLKLHNQKLSINGKAL